eukprot:scaffold1769_cov132-Skeletonema_dohrnii-CCMP3373.AAC.7
MTSIYLKRRLKGETEEEFHAFINAAFLATRKGDFKEADRLAKIRIQKRRRQHARAYYAKKEDRAKVKVQVNGAVKAHAKASAMQLPLTLTASEKPDASPAQFDMDDDDNEFDFNDEEMNNINNSVMGSEEVNNINNSVMGSYVYIHVMKDGPHNITKQKEKTRRGQLGDIYRIQQQISIMPGLKTMYVAEGVFSLRNCPHGTAAISDKARSDMILANRNIKVYDITKETAKGRVAEVGEVRVVYDDSEQIKMMQTDYSAKFEQQLIAHFILYHKKTDAERKNRNRDIHSTQGFTRLDGGIQDRYPNRHSNLTIQTCNGEKIPIIKTKNFESLPKQVLQHLFEVIFHNGQLFLDAKTGRKRYDDDFRFKLFAQQFNACLGFPNANCRFEYYDILVSEVGVSSSSGLFRHIDGKNCDRLGFDNSVVYSFYSEHDNKFYKCSIIMTSRTVCGAAMQRIKSRISS